MKGLEGFKEGHEPPFFQAFLCYPARSLAAWMANDLMLGRRRGKPPTIKFKLHTEPNPRHTHPYQRHGRSRVSAFSTL